MANRSFCRGGSGPVWTLPPTFASTPGQVIFSSADGQAVWGAGSGANTTKRTGVKASEVPSGIEIADSSFTIYESVESHTGSQDLVTVYIEPEMAFTATLGTTHIDIPLTHTLGGGATATLPGRAVVSIGGGAKAAASFIILPIPSVLRLDLGGALGGASAITFEGATVTYMT